jgi:hypothetical protein
VTLGSVFAMGWVSTLRRSARLERGATMPRGEESRSPVSIDLARPRYVAGETVVARVGGVKAPVGVALVRLERRPCGEGVVLVHERELRDPCGVLELALPPDALPTANGAGCALSYAVQVRAHRVIARAGLEVTAEARPHVARGSSAGDPLNAGWEARHFHLELGDTSLRGGGWIAGRVHRHGSWCPTAIVVRVRCDECWRPRGPVARGMPYWEARTLWAAERSIRLDPETRWAPFSFDVPPGLPPGVEARTIAWRYEVRARRTRAHGPGETAALTPLLFFGERTAPR